MHDNNINTEQIKRITPQNLLISYCGVAANIDEKQQELAKNRML